MLKQATESLKRGGIVAYPTEAVYGLGCDPSNLTAINRLLTLKQRSWTKGLILIAANFSQLQPYLSLSESELPTAVRNSWPGANTWLLPVHPNVSQTVCGEHNTLAVRITAHPTASALCNAFGGAIVSTSANLTGQPPARTIDDLDQALISAIDAILPGDTDPTLQPSQIEDPFTGKIIR